MINCFIQYIGPVEERSNVINQIHLFRYDAVVIVDFQFHVTSFELSKVSVTSPKKSIVFVLVF